MHGFVVVWCSKCGPTGTEARAVRQSPGPHASEDRTLIVGFDEATYKRVLG